MRTATIVNIVRVARSLRFVCLVMLMTVTASCSEATSPETSEQILSGNYTIVDTGQEACYDTLSLITNPTPGQPFYGQDAQVDGNQPSYTASIDGLTVYDTVTGLTWQHTSDTTGDGLITASDKLTWAQAQARPAVLNAASYGGFGDWRLPTIKELYSLIDFRGTDPSGLEGDDTSGLTPFINTDFFQFDYGDVSAGERIIDSQYASSTLYVSTAHEEALFGVNFADGRIKGYGLVLQGEDKTFFVQCVRGNFDYGSNEFTSNGDGTITDQGTGLMWTQADNGVGLNWEEALAWAETENASSYLGYDDWRIPNAKELQSIVDYTRSPDTHSSAAIDPVFTCTAITNEGGQADYPFYWAGTSHVAYNGMAETGAYVAFGRGLGYMFGSWVDVHGAGCQRSDPKSGDPADYPFGRGPQGDAIRIYNYVRLVRDATATVSVPGDQGSLAPDLLMNSPNPFRSSTTLRFDVPSEGARVQLDIFDTQGRLVQRLVQGFVPGGEREVVWSGRNTSGRVQPPGVYFVRLANGGEVEMVRIVRLR